MSYICFQIRQIPDLNLAKYQSLADTGIAGVLKRHENFLRLWHGICMESSTSIHLLYIYLPKELVGQRLKVYFLINGEEKNLDLVTPLLQKSPLSDFFVLEQGHVPNITLYAGATMIKKERIVDIYNSLTNEFRQLYSVPKWNINTEARLYDLWKIMESIGETSKLQSACAFRVDLYSVSIAQEIHDMLLPVLKRLRGEKDIKLLREMEGSHTDSETRDICKEYEEWMQCIETEPHFRVNIYGFAENIFNAKIILNAAGSEALSEGDFSIAMLEPDDDGVFTALSRMGTSAKDYSLCTRHQRFKTWPTTYCLSEIVPFFRLPTLYEGEAIEIPKESVSVPIDEGIYFGKTKNGYPVYFPLQNLSRHCFFTGMPGSGKTNTMLHLVKELNKRKIPFLIMEPAKKEYRALLGYEEMRDIYLFSPHLQSKFPLAINPLEFPKGVRLSEHINSLLEVFEGTFWLEGPTYKFLSNSIQKAYYDYEWDLEEVNRENQEKKYPSLQDVYNNLQKEIENSSYSAETKGNIRAFLQVRLGGLMERDSGELFNVHYSTIPPEEWVTISSIVELEVLGEQAKNFFVLLVCHYILQTLRANPLKKSDKECVAIRHMIFIEEAHNIIAKESENIGNDSVNPKISATAYIVKMLAEVRALQEGIVIADQLPTAIASEVTKNTGLKLVHRLTAQDDREIIGKSISASTVQLERMASLSCGQAFIYHEKTMKPFEIQVAEWISPNNTFNIADDNELYLQLCMDSTVYRTVYKAIHNWEENYLNSLEAKIIEQGKKFRDSGCFDMIKMKIIEAECKQLLKKYEWLKSNFYTRENQNNKINILLVEIFNRISKIIELKDNLKRIGSKYGGS